MKYFLCRIFSLLFWLIFTEKLSILYLINLIILNDKKYQCRYLSRIAFENLLVGIVFD